MVVSRAAIRRGGYEFLLKVPPGHTERAKLLVIQYSHEMFVSK